MNTDNLRSNSWTMVQEYLKMTGQELTDLTEGWFTYRERIFTELVPLALKEKKKIVWHHDREQFDRTWYTLEDLANTGGLN